MMREAGRQATPARTPRAADLRVGPRTVCLRRVPEIAQLIARFGLQPLPREGGWFAPVWRSAESVATPGGPRAAASSILYLLAGAEFSALHRLRGDELWQFHAGDALELLRLDPATGRADWTRLGPAVGADDVPQLLVPRGCWQGARLAAGGRWALVGCTLVPGWAEADFELGGRAALTVAWPQWADAITALTREGA